jgi:DNA end-binding protein Ku
MAPRSIWNGTISFGLAHVPVKLYTATESKTVSFREVHLSDGAPIEHRRLCSKEGTVVPYKEVVKGYEVAEDEYVVLEKDEVKAAAGGRGKVIEIEDFVPGDDIDATFVEKTYYVGCRDEAAKRPARPGARGTGSDAYKVFHAALERTGRVGIGRFTFHDREYLAAVRAIDGVLALHTLRFHDEVIDPGDLDVTIPRKGPSQREVKMAEQLVESLHEEFDPAGYEDTYREAVLDLIDRKAKGKKIERVEFEEPEETDDLVAALEASLKGKGS